MLRRRRSALVKAGRSGSMSMIAFASASEVAASLSCRIQFQGAFEFVPGRNKFAGRQIGLAESPVRLRVFRCDLGRFPENLRRFGDCAVAQQRKANIELCRSDRWSYSRKASSTLRRPLPAGPLSPADLISSHRACARSAILLGGQYS